MHRGRCQCPCWKTSRTVMPVLRGIGSGWSMRIGICGQCCQYPVPFQLPLQRVQQRINLQTNHNHVHGQMEGGVPGRHTFTINNNRCLALALEACSRHWHAQPKQRITIASLRVEPFRVPRQANCVCTSACSLTGRLRAGRLELSA